MVKKKSFEEKLTVVPLHHTQVGLPIFDLDPEDLTSKIKNYNFFDLSSHCRARSSIEFGLKMRSFGAHIFIVGGDLRGRMTSTLSYLESYVNRLPAPSDWVYLHNFNMSHSPVPFQLPRGKGSRLKEVMGELVDSIHLIFNEIFSGSHYLNQVNKLTQTLEEELNVDINTLQEFALSKGLRIENNENEFSIVSIDGSIEVPNQSLDQSTGQSSAALDESIKNQQSKKKPKKESSNKDSPQKSYTQNDIQYIREKITHITSCARTKSREINRKIQALKREEATLLINALVVTLETEFSSHLGSWINELKEDILNHIDDFLQDDQETANEYLLNRYSINLFVDNTNNTHPRIIVDPSPSYESLFGSIKYKSGQTGYVTDFTLIRAGNLQQANGGILVLRAEAIASDGDLWNALKTVMRDRMIRIEERYRENSMPMLDAPTPQAIPLDLQIILVGAPVWYYNYFFHDPEFRNYFKIKADIEPDFPATPENLHVCTHLMRQIVEQKMGLKIEKEAFQRLLGYTSRWANNRQKLSSKYELIGDMFAEASQFIGVKDNKTITLESVLKAIKQRRYRHNVSEDRIFQDIEENVVLIDTQGDLVGTVNGLSVLNLGDHEFGIPNRISARTYVGEEGVINIERLTDMGGPIQQKGAMILDGLLNGLFAQQHAVSCNCSLTFEQNYSGVEGDSATLAELLAILSSLSGLSIRQDISVTGSLNQWGEIQAVGGVNHKIEGFFRLCDFRGLTGTQGIILPASNITHVILHEDITEAVAQEKFFVWPVHHLEEAIQLCFGIPAGKLNKNGEYPKDSVYGRVSRQLNKFARVIDSKK